MKRKQTSILMYYCYYCDTTTVVIDVMSHQTVSRRYPLFFFYVLCSFSCFCFCLVCVFFVIQAAEGSGDPIWFYITMPFISGLVG